MTSTAADRAAISCVPTGATGGVLVGALGPHNDVDRHAEPVGVPAGRAAEPRRRPRPPATAGEDSASRSTRLLQLRPRRRDAIERCDVEEIPFLLSSEVFRACRGRRTSVRSPPVSSSRLRRESSATVPRQWASRGRGTSAAVAAGPQLDESSPSLRRRSRARSRLEGLGLTGYFEAQKVWAEPRDRSRQLRPLGRRAPAWKPACRHDRPRRGRRPEHRRRSPRALVDGSPRRSRGASVTSPAAAPPRPGASSPRRSRLLRIGRCGRRARRSSPA